MAKKTRKKTPRVSEEIRGHLLLRDEIAIFRSLSIVVPGANVTLEGQYELPSQRVHLHGDLNTHAEISKQTTGIKAVLLKPLDPLFKRNHHGATVPVGISGTYDQPHFGIDLSPRK